MRLKDTVTGEERELEVRGLFVAIGHTPATKFLQGSGLEFLDSGFVKLGGRSSRTNLPRVYAAGDVTDETYKQAITAAGMVPGGGTDAEHDWARAGGVVRRRAQGKPRASRCRSSL
ncbi:MAG: FAD-dependent oxidoreductase [Phycisphaerales bacterium]